MTIKKGHCLCGQITSNIPARKSGLATAIVKAAIVKAVGAQHRQVSPLLTPLLTAL